jgi:hypothetical protein
MVNIKNEEFLKLFFDCDSLILVAIGENVVSQANELYDFNFVFYPYEDFLECRNQKKPFEKKLRFLPINIKYFTEFSLGTVWNKTGEILYHNIDIAPFKCTFSVSATLYSKKLSDVYSTKKNSYFPIYMHQKGFFCYMIKHPISGEKLIVPLSIVARKLFFVTSDMIEHIINGSIEKLYDPQSIKLDSKKDEICLTIRFRQKLNEIERFFVACFATMDAYRKTVTYLSNSFRIFNNRALGSSEIDFNLFLLDDLKLSMCGYEIGIDGDEKKIMITQITNYSFKTPFNVINYEVIVEERKESSNNNSSPGVIDERYLLDIDNFTVDVDSLSSPYERSTDVMTGIKDEELDLQIKFTPDLQNKTPEESRGYTIKNLIPTDVGSASVSTAKDSTAAGINLTQKQKGKEDNPNRPFYYEFVEFLSAIDLNEISVDVLRCKNKIFKFVTFEENGKKPSLLRNEQEKQESSNYQYIIISIYLKKEKAKFYLIEFAEIIKPRNHYLSIIFDPNFSDINTEFFKKLLSASENYDGSITKAFKNITINNYSTINRIRLKHSGSTYGSLKVRIRIKVSELVNKRDSI